LIEGFAGGRPSGFKQPKIAAGFLAGNVAGAGTLDAFAGEEAYAGGKFMGEQRKSVGVSARLSMPGGDEGGGRFARLGGNSSAEEEGVVQGVEGLRKARGVDEYHRVSSWRRAITVPPFALDRTPN
jgi:hypothetical protein